MKMSAKWLTHVLTCNVWMIARCSYHQCQSKPSQYRILTGERDTTSYDSRPLRCVSQNILIIGCSKLANSPKYLPVLCLHGGVSIYIRHLCTKSDSYYWDKTVSRPSYLNIENSMHNKTFFYGLYVKFWWLWIIFVKSFKCDSMAHRHLYDCLWRLTNNSREVSKSRDCVLYYNNRIALTCDRHLNSAVA